MYDPQICILLEAVKCCNWLCVRGLKNSILSYILNHSLWGTAYGYLPGFEASPPLHWYQMILLEDSCGLPRAIPDSAVAETRTRDLSIMSPTVDH